MVLRWSQHERRNRPCTVAGYTATLACTRLTPIGSKLSAPFEADGPPLRAASL